MSDYKFRAWDKKNKLMHMVTDIDFCSHKINVHPDYDCWIRYGDYELMHFTGLHDRDGKEIYEGDIMNMRYDEPIDRPHIIVWFGTCSRFIAIHLIEYKSFKQGKRKTWFSNIGKIPNAFDARVIGNIYENPNLLEGKE